MTSVEFEVPARAEYVSLVRMLASSLALTRRQVDEEFVDNLKLAVSEACTLVVESPSAERLMMSWREDDDALIIDVKGIGQNEEDATVPYQIIRALVDKVEHVDLETLRLRMLCPPI
jgi:hypothetical protein